MKDLLPSSSCSLAVPAPAEIGCRPRPKVGLLTITKVEYFRAKQAHTTTTHGKIVLESVKETKDGVEYKTEDGKTLADHDGADRGEQLPLREPKPAD
jgi:hypothetical protein